MRVMTLTGTVSRTLEPAPRVGSDKLNRKIISIGRIDRLQRRYNGATSTHALS